MATQTADRPATMAGKQPRFPRQGEWTYEDWLKFPTDGWKYEIIVNALFDF